MAQRRPIASHPAFAPLVALWFAALFGLGVAVLPGAAIDRALAGLGIASWFPEGAPSRWAAIGLAGLLGGVLGWLLSRLLGRRQLRDPRPTYAETEPGFDEPAFAAPARRPLHVREELADDHGDGSGWEEPRNHHKSPADEGGSASASAKSAVNAVEGEEGFMILTPQPVHPPRPAPDLEGLLEQFDNAIAAFRSGENERPARAPGERDPVHAFVARQTGTPAPSPLGGHMPDHQAELRAALDKLARAHRKD